MNYETSERGRLRAFVKAMNEDADDARQNGGCSECCSRHILMRLREHGLDRDQPQRCETIWRAGILTPPNAPADRTRCSLQAGHVGPHHFSPASE